MSAETPPCALAAEASLLGAVFIRPEFAGVVDLSPDEFYSPANREVWEAMQAVRLRRHPMDPVTVGAEIRTRGGVERLPGGEGYLLELVSAPSSHAVAEPAHFAGLIRKAAMLRKIIATCARGQGRAFGASESPGEVLADIRRELAEIELAGDSGGPVRVGDKLGEVLADVGDRGQNPSRHGVPTGIAAFDVSIGHLRPKRLIVVAARPGIGKTAFAGTVALNAAKGGIPVLVFSLEMAFAELAERFIGAEALVDVDSLGRGRISRDEAARLHNGSLTKLAAAPLFVDDRPQSMGRLCSTARAWRAQHQGRVLVVIDYLGLIRATGKSETRTLEVGRMAWAGKMLAKELDAPVMLVSQLNRGLETGEPPELRHLRDSGEIEQHADQVIFPHRTGDLSQDGPAELVVGKNRGGRIGVVPCWWSGKFTTFQDDRQEAAE